MKKLLIKTNLMKILLLFFAITGLSCTSCAQKNSKADIWSGTYVLRSSNGNSGATAIDTLVIEQADKADDKIPVKYKSDLSRWTLTAKKDTKDKVTIRRFLFDLENEENEYDQFGWTDLHVKGKMNCIDGGHFFICQTEPNTTVKFNKEESFFTKTGILAIWLHHGLFELEKIK